jgi:hypothetical protein
MDEAEIVSSDPKSRIPVALKMVAILFIVAGVLAIVEIVIALMRNHLNINLGVLNLFIGLGLLRLSRGWRTCALVFLWIAIIGLPIVAVVFLGSDVPLELKLFGQKIGHASKGLATTFVAVLFVVVLWQYWVLTRADIRKLFDLSGA